jgi:hypothetical protein
MELGTAGHRDHAGVPSRDVLELGDVPPEGAGAPMANERLRGCLAAAELTTADLAAHVGVDVKTVERWIAKGRVPYRAHRTATATLLRTTEAYLWPDVLDDPQATSTSRAELVTLYPHRGAVPKDLWMRLIEAAEEHIDVLVYAGLFLPDGHPELAKVLISKAEQGTAIRQRSPIPTPRPCACAARRSTSARGWRLGFA